VNCKQQTDQTVLTFTKKIFVRRHWPQTRFHIRPINRGFSKLALVKRKERKRTCIAPIVNISTTKRSAALHNGSTATEALLLASVEKDIVLELDDAELVARFTSKSDRQMMLD